MIPLEFILPIIAQVLTIFLGIVVFLKNPKERANRIFSYLVLFCVFWIFSVLLSDFLKDYFIVLFWTKIAIVGPVMVGVTFYYFSKIFLDDKVSFSLTRQILVFLPVLFFLVLTPTSLNVKSISIEPWGTSFTPGPLYYCIFFYLLLYFGGALRNLMQSYRKVTEKVEKYQIFYVIIGAVGSLIIGLVTNLVFPILGFAETSKYGPSLSILFFVLFNSYAILKHHLFDIKVLATEFFVGTLGFILLVQALTVPTPFLKIINFTIFFLFLIFGYSLIRSVINEVNYRQKLQIAYQEVEKLSKAKSEFISIASHQIRTPLTAIKGYISMMLEDSYGKLVDRVKTPLENVYKSNERLIKLVNDLLCISRIESGKMELELEESSIEEIVMGVVNDLKITAEKKNLYLKLEKPAEPLPKIMLDKGKMRQVILNLVDNAIKYTLKGGITINAKMMDSKFQILIRDTGEGISKEDLVKLFESFSRGIVGSQSYTGGTGLGLYIARRFVEMHNGKIWAESDGIDKGSSFFIELPIN